MYSLFADESFEDNAGLFTVAAYLIGSKGLARFTEAWATALGSLNYFHMCDGHYKTHPEVYEKLLGLMTHDHLIVGFASSVNQDEYKRVMSLKLRGQSLQYWFGGHYSFCVSAIVDLANKWLDANNPNEQNVAYVFEAGYEREGEADMFLQKINSDPLLADRKHQLRYFSHGFMDGKRKESGALHAADIMAWHVATALRTGTVSEAGQRLIDSVPIYTVRYPEKDIEQNVRAQLEFCNFYGDLRTAKRLS